MRSPGPVGRAVGGRARVAAVLPLALIAVLVSAHPQWAGSGRAQAAEGGYASAWPAGPSPSLRDTGKEAGPSPSVRRLTRQQRRAMRPDVWRPGCPVPLRKLRTVRARHWDFDGGTSRGRLVVHRQVAASVKSLLVGLYDMRFPIRLMVPIRRYGGSDFASIEADNTSAFNCRNATGSGDWSQHAYGRAIDINPLENPYVRRGRTSHSGSVEFLDRRNVRRGMLVVGSPEVDLVESLGWRWGGRWSDPTDYQHVWAPRSPRVRTVPR